MDRLTSYLRSENKRLSDENKSVWELLTYIVHDLGDEVRVRPDITFNPKDYELRTYFDSMTMEQVFSIAGK